MSLIWQIVVLKNQWVSCGNAVLYVWVNKLSGDWFVSCSVLIGYSAVWDCDIYPIPTRALVIFTSWLHQYSSNSQTPHRT